CKSADWSGLSSVAVLQAEAISRGLQHFAHRSRCARLRMWVIPPCNTTCLGSHVRRVALKDGALEGFRHFMDRVTLRYNRPLLLPFEEDAIKLETKLDPLAARTRELATKTNQPTFSTLPAFSAG